MLLQEWGDVLTQSFQDLGAGVISFVPQLLVAIIIFLAGWVVGSLLGSAIARIIKAIKLDSALKGAGIESVVEKAGFRLDSGKFVGVLVEWFVIIAFLIAALDVLGLSQVNAFLTQVVTAFLPQVITAVLILLVAGVVAEVMRNIVKGAAKASGIASGEFLGTVTKWAIWVFAILAALSQVDVPAAQILLNGLVIAVAVALGLAFGLGGQGAAADVLDRVRREMDGK